MFIPEHYRAQDPRKTIREHPFATLVSTENGNIFATATPLYFKTDRADESVIIGHVAARNPQVATLIDGAHVLAIFNGPHAYVSANWYETPPLIPTWNYLITQLKGTIRTQPSDEEKRTILKAIAAKAESWNEPQWTIENAAPGEFERFLGGIHAFEIDIQSIEGADKLCQTRTREDAERVISKLEARNFTDDKHIAAKIRELTRAG